MTTSELNNALKSAVIPFINASLNEYCTTCTFEGATVTQTDTAKFAIPVMIEGVIRYVEISLVAKKEDFDLNEATAKYAEKCEKAHEREIEKQLKKKTVKKNNEE